MARANEPNFDRATRASSALFVRRRVHPRRGLNAKIWTEQPDVDDDLHCELDVEDAHDNDQLKAEDAAYLNRESFKELHSAHYLVNMKKLHFLMNKQRDLLLTMMLHILCDCEEALKFNTMMLFEMNFSASRPVR